MLKNVYNAAIDCIYGALRGIITSENLSRTRRNLAEIKPKITKDPQNRIFQMHLESMINMEHENRIAFGENRLESLREEVR
ncbi:MAG: hypothetical protein VB076_11610 [Synergistaceae bacterium]|nr:hypothetical protein [Synergistaceae bacterium]